MRKTDARFLKGINRRLPAERAEPDSVFTLQNARLWVRGATSYIKRILGFSLFSPAEEDYSTVLDMIHRDGKLIILYEVSIPEEGLLDENGTIILTEDLEPIT